MSKKKSVYYLLVETKIFTFISIIMTNVFLYVTVNLMCTLTEMSDCSIGQG